jgi:hypothetical protein
MRGRFAHGVGAHGAGILGHGHRMLANGEAGHLHRILRRLVIKRIFVVGLVAAHGEDAGGHGAERRQHEFDTLPAVAAKAQGVERHRCQV